MNLSCRNFFAVLTGVLLCPAFSEAQEKKETRTPEVETGKILDRSYDFKAAKKKMGYCLFVPKGYDESKKYPLMVALHGLGATPRIQMRYPGLTKLAQKYGYIVVAPMGYNTRGWYGSRGLKSRRSRPENLGELSEKDVMNVLGIVRKEFSIDPNRIYLMGHSMGGGGTWHLGLKYPKLWAALAPIAPAIFRSPNELKKIKHMPVILVQGDKDRLVPVRIARKWAAKMKELGMKYQYIEVKDGGHVYPAFQKLPDIFAFLDKQRKTSSKKAKPNTTNPQTEEISVQQGGEKFQPRKHGKEAREAGLDPKVLAKLDVTIQQYIAKKDVSGAVLLISRNGKIGYHEAFGFRDIGAKKTMLEDVIFRIYSMTKPIVTFAAMLLYERGELDLDEPISKRLPEWKNVKVLERKIDKKTKKVTFRLVPAKNPITVRDLMRHSSGLYYGFNPKSPASKMLTKAGVFEKGINLAEFSKRLAKAPLKFQPGTAYNYGYSIDILGRYVEAVSKQPLDAFLRKNVFKPLKMKDTSFWVSVKKLNRLAVVYRRDKGKLVPAMSNKSLLRKPSLLKGGGGLLSTSTDYWRFCQMLLNRGELDGVRVAKAKTVNLMFQNQLGSVYKDGKKTYGLGGAVDGKGGYFWGGAAGTKFFVDTKNKLVVVYMIQRRGYQSLLWPQVQRLAREAVRRPKKAE